MLFYHLYQDSVLAEIEQFINEVVVDGRDVKKEARQIFFEKNILPKNGKLPVRIFMMNWSRSCVNSYQMERPAGRSP